MKKLLKLSALALLLPALAFVSCNNDDDETVLNTPAPSKGVVTVGSGEITVSWTPPQIPMNNPMKNYTVTWTPGDGTATVVTGVNSYTAKDLTSGTKYTFVIKANYANGVSSTPLVLQGIPVKGEAFAAVAALDADTVLFDAETKTYEFYFNKDVDLAKVAVGMTLNENATIGGESGVLSKTLNLSAGSQKLTAKVGSEDIEYTFKATKELLLTGVASTAFGADAKVTLDQSKQSVVIDYGVNPVDKAKLNLTLTAIEGAMFVSPSSATGVVDASAGTYNIVLKNKYGHAVTYTITKITGSAAPFDPKDITGIAITSTRVYTYNDKAVPTNLAVYSVAGGKGYLVIAKSEGSSFTVFGGSTAKSFTSFVTDYAATNSILVAGNIVNNRAAFHNGAVVIKGDLSPTFAINSDGTYAQASGQFNGETFVNYDAGQTAWSVKEGFSGTGLYMATGYPLGYVETGATKAPHVFFATTPNLKMFGFMVVPGANFSQDQVCKTLINVGLTQGFPMNNPNDANTVTGLYVNGKAVFEATGNVYTAIGMNMN